MGNCIVSLGEMNRTNQELTYQRCASHPVTLPEITRLGYYALAYKRSRNATKRVRDLIFSRRGSWLPICLIKPAFELVYACEEQIAIGCRRLGIRHGLG